MAVAELPEGAGDGADLFVSILPSGHPSSQHVTTDFPVSSANWSLSGDTVTIELEPGDVPDDYVDPGGLVTLEVAYIDDEQGTMGSAIETVRAVVVDGEGNWIDPSQHLPSMDSNPTSRRPRVDRADVAAAAGAVGLADLRATLNENPARLKVPDREFPSGSTGGTNADSKSASAIRGAEIATAAYTPRASSSSWSCNYGNKWTKRWATIGTSYPKKKQGSTSWLTYTSSSTSKFGIAVNYGDGWIKTSSTRTLSDSWGQDFTGSRDPDEAQANDNRSYRVAVRYRKRACSYMRNFVLHTKVEWVPQYETGGTWSYKLSGKPDWRRYCDRIAAGKWWRGRERGHDYTLSYGVKFKGKIGVDLQTQRAYSSGSRLYYHRERRRALCGEKHYPALAAKMRERNFKFLVNNDLL